MWSAESPLPGQAREVIVCRRQRPFVQSGGGGGRAWQAPDANLADRACSGGSLHLPGVVRQSTNESLSFPQVAADATRSQSCATF